MRQVGICILFLSIILFSFKTIDRKKMLIRTWHAVKLQSPQLDSFFKSNKTFIDTMGRHSDADTKMQLYGTTNMDSMRLVLRSQLDSFMSAQMRSVKSTIFTFRKDSVALLAFDAMTDSCKWYLDKAGKLMLTPINENDQLFSNLNIQLVSLTESAMKLKFIEDDGYTIVTFLPKIK